VPSALKPALLMLAELPEASAIALISAVRSLKTILNPKKMAAAIRPEVPSIAGNELESLLKALFSLSAARVTNTVSIASFLDDVCESLDLEKKGAPDLLRSRLEQLLRAEPIVLASKASAIQREHSNVMLNARVLTDVRPVFGDGPEAIRGAVITHSLKLTYIHSGELEESFFALDDEDLAKLQKAIVRAEYKSKAIRLFMDKSGLLGMEQDSE
jgi:hypothetical protein